MRLGRYAYVLVRLHDRWEILRLGSTSTGHRVPWRTTMNRAFYHRRLWPFSVSVNVEPNMWWRVVHLHWRHGFIWYGPVRLGWIIRR